MTNDIKQITEQIVRLVEELDQAPPQQGSPTLLPETEARDRQERAEAARVLNDWLERPNAPLLLCGEEGTETVLGTCGATRTYMKRVLSDAGKPSPSLMLRRNGEAAVGTIRVKRDSPLARASGWSPEDTVEVEIPAASFAAQISRRTNATEAEGLWLWNAVHASLEAPNTFAYLFRGLDIQGRGRGVVEVRPS
jgi:hypothetical protein